MKIFFIAFLLLISVSVNSQQMDKIILWPGVVPGETAQKHDPVKTDNTKGDVIRLTDVTNPVMEVFKPKDEDHNAVGIIVCPGGGYNILAVNLEGYEAAEWLSSLGYTAFVLQYRVPDKKEGALMDLQRAVRIVRAGSTEWGIDPGKIGVMGFSAGGSLSARASTLYSIEMYPPVDEADKLSSRPDFSILIYPAYLDQGENRSITPELQINEKTPPIFIFGTADDHYGNSSLVMAGALRDAKVPVELHFIPEGGHGYGLRPGNIAAETWPVLLEKWLVKR